MFRISKKHTIALSAVGIAGLMSIGLLAAQADTGVTPTPTTTPVSSMSSDDTSLSSDDTATDVPSAFPDAPDDSDGRISGGHGSDDVNDAPDDSDGRVDDSDSDDDSYDDSGYDDSGYDDSDDSSDDSGHGSDDD